MHINENGIWIKEQVKTLQDYKYMIIFIVVLFGISSSYYAYFKPNIYRASATVELGLEYSSQGQDKRSEALELPLNNIDTEIEIIKSRFLSQRVLKEINFSHKYYTTRKFKEIELYKDSPFQIAMKKGYDISFDLYPVDAKKYRLVTSEAAGIDGSTWSYDKVLPYSKEIITEHFHLNIIKTKEAKDAQYRFVIKNPDTLENVLQNKINASKTSNFSSIIKISYVDTVALRAQEVCNTLSQIYIDQSVEKKTKEASSKLIFIDKQIKRITESLKSSAIKLEEFKKASNTIDLSKKAESVIRNINENETKLAELAIEEEMLNSLYNQIKVKKNFDNVSVTISTMGNPMLSSMIQKLHDATMKKKIVREDYTELHPQVRKLSKVIDQYKKEIVSAIENFRKSSKEQKKLLIESMDRDQKVLNKLPTDQRMFVQLERKFTMNEKVYIFLLEKRLETEIIKASKVSSNRIIDKALTPKSSIKPDRKKIIMIGLLIGLILGILLALLRNFLDNRIRSGDNIGNIGEIPIVGTIPNIKKDSNKLKVFLSPKSAVAEAFRNLRTNLQFMSNYKTTHTIVVTSTVGGEGKTTTSINLSGIMSMADKKTILLNFDMRKPTLHAKFGLSNKNGMSTFLSGSTNLSEVIQKTEYENLDVITSGPIPPNPSELIQGELTVRLLEKLKEIYDVIILDTPPVGLVVDAKTLMQHADTTIYVLRENYSKKSFIKNIKQLSSIKNIHGLSILINDVKQGTEGYGYGYYEE